MAGRWCAERQNHDYGGFSCPGPSERHGSSAHSYRPAVQRSHLFSGPPPERPVQHPHLRQGPPAGRPVQRSHLCPGAIDRPREARYSSPFGDPLCNIPTGRWAGFVGQNPRPCGVPPGHLPTASLEGCVSQDLSPCRPPVQHPHGCSRPVVCFACETFSRAIGAASPPMSIHA